MKDRKPSTGNLCVNDLSFANLYKEDDESTESDLHIDSESVDSLVALGPRDGEHCYIEKLADPEFAPAKEVKDQIVSLHYQPYGSTLDAELHFGFIDPEKISGGLNKTNKYYNIGEKGWGISMD